ncbi:metallophosphoesterase family protein [Paenibacillus antri]|uniref:Phosphoesterase n=1 Tax=Paenibacillus antri TaxID=2582848 RepID=A0A5R9GBU5_9BACL|nr:metallophosphoesterase [Paenibacillus antri]TLS50193.1 metallophosphoesterase family protein [Paenibacillus antri]
MSAPLRIGVVSDTHMFSRGAKLPNLLVEGLRGVDLLLHAGDFTDPAVVPLLEAVAPLEAVAGNNDGIDIVRRFGFRKIVEAGGRRIGLVHGHDGPGRSTEAKAAISFRDDPVDIVVFGHSHVPYYEMSPDGVLLFNPGSPTDKRRQPRYSYGLIEIGERIEAAHRYYDDKA